MKALTLPSPGGRAMDRNKRNAHRARPRTRAVERQQVRLARCEIVAVDIGTHHPRVQLATDPGDDDPTPVEADGGDATVRIRDARSVRPEHRAH